MDSSQVHRDTASGSSNYPQESQMLTPSVGADKMFHALSTVDYLGESFRSMAGMDDFVSQYMKGSRMIRSSDVSGQV